MRKPMGGHFGSSINGNSAAHDYDINGLCTPCHDPHGVTGSLGANRQYGVPLLKGTWLTSPYKEDKADKVVARGGGSKVPSFYGAAVPGYHIDQNTLLHQPAPLPIGGGSSVLPDTGPVAAPQDSKKSDNRGMAFRNLSNSGTKVEGLNAGAKKTTAEFAGLCTRCHNQASLTGRAFQRHTSAAWLSKERIHQTVNGWGVWSSSKSATANKKNKIHAFTCSKCHAPHVSKLPRLMTTNCLDANHAGQVVSNPNRTMPKQNQTAYYQVGNNQVIVTTAAGAGRFPGGGRNYWVKSTSKPQNYQRNAGPWWFQTWPSIVNNTVSGGTITDPVTAPYTKTDATYQPYATSCHNSPTAGGGSYNWDPVLQQWNTKTPW